MFAAGRTTMGGRHGKPHRKTPPRIDPTKTVAQIVQELKKSVAPALNYRERSLQLHGLICAKCGREFDEKNRHLLTVHHKDGDHMNNPSDGSNWENLCVYCHEDEHSRGLLADYYRKSGE
jgi:5-methylcytosine-specific restriction endonuclease McrA